MSIILAILAGIIKVQYNWKPYSYSNSPGFDRINFELLLIKVLM